MLAVINFPKVNEKCIKILKCLHKAFVFERVNAKNHTIATVSSQTMCCCLFFHIKFGLSLDKFIKVLKVLLNFSNYVSLIVICQIC